MPDYTYRCLSCDSITAASHEAKQTPVIPCEQCGGLTRRVVLTAPTVLKKAPAVDSNKEEPHECHAHCALHYSREHWLDAAPHTDTETEEG